MSLASFSVRRPVAVLMGMLAVILIGGVCVFRLPIDLLPEVSFPTVSVRTIWPNVSPEEMELMVTRPIEQAVSSATNLYRVTSTSYQGQSEVRVEFNYGVDMDSAAVEVLQLVQRSVDKLPDDVTLKNPVVYKFNPNDLPIMRFGVSAPGSPVKLRTMVDELIVPRLEAVNGVGAAEVVGGTRREIRVEVDLEKLRARNLTLADISRRLGQENANIPGGLAREGNVELAIRSLGLFSSPSEIDHVVLTSYQGQAVYLRDVARVMDDKEEERSITRLNGQPSVGIWVRKQSTANTVATAIGLRAEIERLKKDYPQVAWGVTSDYASFIEQSVHHTQREALIGAILAILVILFFLRNLRSTLVIGLSIPISLCATFALLYLCGFTLNVMSLSGIALAVGLIVDDAIVVLENIYRHVERDRLAPREAAVSATNEVATPVVAATVTVMVVFLPLLFVRGVTGQMYKQLALTIVFAIGMSLLMAMTLVPMLASRMLQDSERPAGRLAGALYDWSGRRFQALDDGYRELLRWALNHRGLTILLAMGTLGASLLLYPMIGTELMPPTDNGDFRVSLKMPVGTALSITNTNATAMEQKLNKVAGVDTVFATIGSSGFSNRPMPHQAQMSVRLVMGEAAGGRERATADVMRDARKELGGIPGANVIISQFDLVARLLTGGDNIELRIFGNDAPTLIRLGRQVLDEIRTVPGFSNGDLSWQNSTPELRVVVDRQKAASLGLSFADIANTIGAATGGDVATYYEEGGFSYPVRVQLREDQRKTTEALGRIVLRAGQTQLTSQIALPRGQWIRLNQVARIEVAEGPNEISRLNRERYLSVTGSPVDRPVGDVVKEINQRLTKIKLPTGYRFSWGGAQEQMSRNFGDLALAVILAVVLIYMVLAAQFESLVHPFTIMLSVPLSVIGVLLALFLTGKAFGMTAYIGLLMLVGLVVKNSILLVDYTNVLRGHGMERTAAVLRAGPTRLRPILMTSGAAILGMVPLALGLGKGTETQSPMATAVIGGLITSTLLTLLVIPVVYTLLDDIIQRSRPTRPRPAVVPDEAREPRASADPRREVPGYRFQSQSEP
jgi:hydrophobic/amphiphilic exporter-1 (mainly G- bacteria), HAE1 family